MESLESAMRIFGIKAKYRSELADKVLLMAGQYLKQKRIKMESEEK